MVYHDLNVSLPASLFANPSGSSSSSAGPSQAAGPNGGGKKNKKNKQANQQQQQQKQAGGAAAVGSSSGSTTGDDPLNRLSKAQRDELEARVKDLRDLGYSTIAFNHIVESKFDHNLHKNPFHSPPSTTSSPLSPNQVMPPVSSPIFPSLAKGKNPIRQLHRLTFVLDAASESKSGNGLVPLSTPALLSYDLLAVKPLTANAFNAACLTHTELKPGVSFDIISLDLSSTPRLPFFLKRSTVGKAIENGAVFEVCYSDALPFGNQPPLPSVASGGHQLKAEDRLRNLISNTRDLLRVTNGGRGLLLSSGASSVLGLRGPGDILNLAKLFGFSQGLARDALTETCRALLLRAETRRSFRGVVGWPRVVDPVGEPEKAMGTATTAAVAVAVPAGNADAGASVATIRTARDPDPEEDMGFVSPGEKKRKLEDQKGKNGKKQRQK
ncbi:PHP domain-like protein [Microstroma glucosiphilum]|uniref:PHP domain-like protein n=1 Tax=Pseudomicrostroma glucosiphilum TaxID=1684307 RepID=A0A316TXH4_9BASI|nr:PHP domain-like protein [Pseudomicrostroma glucosiphilum]PWN18109.1 PHP domain-like protein [Pseudomicrostroma glucosiphilum]